MISQELLELLTRKGRAVRMIPIPVSKKEARLSTIFFLAKTDKKTKTKMIPIPVSKNEARYKHKDR